MNALMRVQIRVINETARELARLQKDLAAVEKSAGRMGRAGTEASRFMRGPDLIRFGKDLQWTGRQIEYNFTLPLIAAGKAGFDMVMKQEKAFTRLKKVYGDVGSATSQFAGDFALLRRAARALSDTFGVHQDQVLEIMATWAAAGAEGYALAKATQTTMQAMILGELEAADATKALISIQQGYKLSSNQLVVVLAQLNAVENETSANLGELIDAFQRASGSAYQAGVTTGELASMVAALVPAAGSGANAGNALKTVFSRLAAPTKEAAGLMRKMGLEIDGAAWLSASATGRLEMMAKAFNGLTDAQKQVASAFIAGRYQVNRFDMLMAALTSTTSQYAIAQRAVGEGAEGQRRAIQQMNNEIGIFLRSSPQAIKILQVRMMNLLSQVMVPLVPAIIQVLTAAVHLADAFAKLPPEIQTIVIGLLAGLAVLGPFIRYFGAFTTLLGIGRVSLLRVGQALGFFSRTMVGAGGASIVARRGLLQFIALIVGFPFRAIGALFSGLWAAIMRGAAFMWRGLLTMTIRGAGGLVAAFARLGPVIMAAITSPLGLAIIAAGALMIFFRKQIGDAISAVIRAFNRLPAGIVNAFRAVVRVVKAAVMAVYKLLSYLNPFARHSPSLVDQVRAGVDLISDLYAGLGNVGANFRRAIDDLEAFKRATASTVASFEAAEFAEFAAIVSPADLAAVDAMRASIDGLKGDLAALGREYAQQSAVVENFRVQLEAVNKTLEDAQERLDQLQDAASAARDELDAAKQTLDDLAHTPIAGMRAMEDQIFANEMAQKRLRLEMMRWEDANGSIDDARNKMAALAGEIELLQGEQASLRDAGAGGDILKFYDDQIAALDQQGDAINQSFSEFEKMEKEMQRLRHEGEMLELQNSITFDPLLRELDQVVNGMQEMPFDELLGKIKTQQAEVARLTAVWDQADAAVREQQQVVDNLTAARDALQATYDAEEGKLDRIGQAYDLLEGQIRDMESALADFMSLSRQAAEEAAAGAGNASELFDAAALGGDIPDPNADLPSGVDDGDLAALVAEFEKNARDVFGNMDFLGWFKDKWNQAWAWVKENVGPYVEPIVHDIVGWFERVDWDKVIEDGPGKIAEWFKNGPLGPAVEGISGYVETIAKGIGKIWDIVGPDLLKFGKMIVDFIVRLVDTVGNELKNWAPLFDQVVEAIGHVFNVLKTIFTVDLAILIAAWKVAWAALEPILRPILSFITEAIRAALEIIRGIITFILAVINGDWSAAWNALLTIIDGVWDMIVAVVDLAWDLVWGIIDAGLSELELLWDAAWWAIHAILSAVWDAIKAVVETVFKIVWGIIEAHLNIIKTIWDVAWNVMKTVLETIWGVIRTVIETGINAGREVIETAMNVISTVWDTVWNAISTTLSTIWGVIKGVFQAIINFVNDKLMPIWNVLKDAILGAFNGVKDALGGIWDRITGIIRGAVNFGIRVINTLIDGINAIADIVPGVNFHINHVHEFGGGSSGGGGAGSGWMQGFAAGTAALPTYDLSKRGPFMTNGARGIVGEGNRSYPEFVIPTDPKWRSRAESLFAMLAMKLGMGGGGDRGTPQFGIGGILPDIGGALRAGWDATGGKVVSAVRKGAVMAAFAPFLKAADVIISLIPWDLIANIANNIKNAVYNWAKGEDHAVNTELSRQEEEALRAAVDAAAAQAAQTTGSTTGGGSSWGRRGGGWGREFGGTLPPHMWRGGIIRGSTHGTTLVAGDRNRDEAILPLPNGWEDGLGKREYNFYGDLEFPNIKSGADAEDFIRNLESLV